MGRADSPLLDRMVFLVGAQRSGTNWLQRMLAAHPGVVPLPSETQLFTAGIDVLAERVQHGVLSSTSTATVFMDRDAFLDAARAFCDAAYGGVVDRLDPTAPRVLERSPNHVERLELIGAVYPDAWIVHLVRDGRDVARSLSSQQWGPATVAQAAELWSRSVRTARAAAPSLARYREVRYEDLLADPAAGLVELFGFLGLEADAAVVSAVLHEAGVAYNTDSRRPDIGAGKWRTEWTRRDLAAFDRVAGDVLRDLGYGEAATPGRRLRRRRPSRQEPGNGRRPYLPMEVRQRRVDAFCAALAAGDAAAAAALLSPSAAVRVVDVDRDETARGEAAHTLLSAVATDAWGPQRRGDVHVGATMFAVVLTNDSGPGRRDRLVVVHFDGADAITAVTVYGFPL